MSDEKQDRNVNAGETIASHLKVVWPAPGSATPSTSTKTTPTPASPTGTKPTTNTSRVIALTKFVSVTEVIEVLGCSRSTAYHVGQAELQYAGADRPDPERVVWVAVPLGIVDADGQRLEQLRTGLFETTLGEQRFGQPCVRHFDRVGLEVGKRE